MEEKDDESRVDVGGLLRAVEEAMEILKEVGGGDGDGDGDGDGGGRGVEEAVEKTWEAMESGLEVLMEEAEPVAEQLAVAVRAYQPGLKEWRRFWKRLSGEARTMAVRGAFERLNLSHDLFVSLIPGGTLESLSSCDGMPMLVGGAVSGRELDTLSLAFGVARKEWENTQVLTAMGVYLVRALSSSVLYLSSEWEPPYCDPSLLSPHDHARRDLFRQALSLPTPSPGRREGQGVGTESGCVGIVAVGVVTLVGVAFVMFAWDTMQWWLAASDGLS